MGSGWARGLLVDTGASTGAAASRNPYQEIAARNIFGLRPPQPVHVEPPPAPPIPKIVLTGITTFFGEKRALLRVQVPAQPRQPAKEESYILSEGQRDGQVEVLKINERTAHVTVEISGQVAEITFEKSPPPPSPPAPSAPVRARPVWPRLPQQATAGLGGMNQFRR